MGSSREDRAARVCRALPAELHQADFAVGFTWRLDHWPWQVCTWWAHCLWRTLESQNDVLCLVPGWCGSVETFCQRFGGSSEDAATMFFSYMEVIEAVQAGTLVTSLPTMSRAHIPSDGTDGNCTAEVRLRGRGVTPERPNGCVACV